jgi:DNA (cytosine-5)-methyltransferase 1
MRPIGIDLFAGAGGMSLGFEQAGFDVVAAVEIDPIHAAAHKFNFPHCEVLAQSVIGLSGPEIRRRAGIEGRQVDVVFGGAPCQGFSLIGHRALDDPRNALVNEFVRLVTELDSSYFVFENVKGLTVGRHKELLNEIIKEFENRGYAVRKSWSVLNAVNFGVPQHRERLILMGAKEGLPLPVYPSGNSASANRREFFSGPTCRDALEDLPNAEDFPELISSDEVETDAWGKPSAYAKEMRCIENEAWHSGYVRRWNSSLLTSSMRTDHTEVSRRRFASISGGEVEPISRFFKLSPDGVSNTLRAGTDAARGAFTSPRPIHYRWARCITVREMARLHGFPDWFRFHETKWHGARQIGNAVPPPLARAVAEQIMLALDIFPTRPKHEIDLGNTAFLKMDMSQAAKFFGVDSPIGRRDRKSGAKKRKQHEIEETRQMFEASNG